MLLTTAYMATICGSWLSSVQGPHVQMVHNEYTLLNVANVIFHWHMVMYQNQLCVKDTKLGPLWKCAHRHANSVMSAPKYKVLKLASKDLSKRLLCVGTGNQRQNTKLGNKVLWVIYSGPGSSKYFLSNVQAPGGGSTHYQRKEHWLPLSHRKQHSKGLEMFKIQHAIAGELTELLLKVIKLIDRQ